MMAINDIEKPLYYIKHKENNGMDVIKLLRQTTFDTFENSFYNLSDSQIDKLSSWVKEVSTPFKYGKRTHLNLDYRNAGSKIYDMTSHVENQRFYSSGDARKYANPRLYL